MSDLPDNSAATLASRRLSPRVGGPFEGRRRGALTVAVRIYDLSVGGCLIESHYEVAPGRRMMLDIEFPEEGCFTLEAETLYTRPDYGFAVKFVNVPGETRARLEGAIERRLASSNVDR